MIFLIDYDRPTQQTLVFRTFEDSELEAARAERLKIELEVNRQGLLMQREVLLLQASSEATIRRTHDRYFEHLPQENSPVVAAD